MRRVVVLALLAGCSSDPTGNPAVLWLIPRNGELNVALGPDEPAPY
jgi:hypothetical protein